MRALDLFCGAGGASQGLAAAGYDVTGVDLQPQPSYRERFIQADALEFPLDGYDLIWASPPCQYATAYRRRPGHVAPAENLIGKVRQRLVRTRTPFVIENVVGARKDLSSPITLCGSMFGLDVQRHRLFETSFPVSAPSCDHGRWSPRFPPATNRKNLRKTVEVGVWRIPLEVQQEAMGIDWMTREELSQAIPPAYAEFLAGELCRWQDLPTCDQCRQPITDQRGHGPINMGSMGEYDVDEVHVFCGDECHMDFYECEREAEDRRRDDQTAIGRGIRSSM